MPIDGVELPPEVQDLLDEHEERDGEHLLALSTVLMAKRAEAINARKESGIEEVWMKAEEAYLGIDDANRGAYSNAKWAKPTNLQGPVTTGTQKENGAKSTAYIRLTSRYVDAGAAKLGEILLPIGEKAFSFTNTPSPDLVSAKADDTPAVHNGVPLMKKVPGETPDAPETEVQATVADVAQEALDRANESAKKAETRIYDWMVESHFPAEMRKVIFDKARIGTGVLKGPFPQKRVSRAKTAEGVVLVTKIVPAYEWKDPWNIFPDPGCGERIRDGDYIFEHDQFSRKQLRALKGAPGYISSAIDKVLAEGPNGGAEGRKPDAKENKHRYSVWYFYGAIKREEFEAAHAAAGGKDKPPEGDEVYAICTMVNDTVIRAVINPLDSGEFPYHNTPWQRRAGHWAGVGVGEQLELPQAMINAATRAMLNNAGKSAGSIIVADRGCIEPANSSWDLTPDKLFYKKDDVAVDDVRKAFAFFEIPNMTPQLMSIVEYALRLAEESTNIPLVTQGQSGPTSPDTFGATQLQNNNANQLLRSIGYGYDDDITDPVVRQSYEMLLLDDEVPEDEKGDWNIDAHGSIALVERAISDQTIQQMGQYALQPAFGVDPKKWFAEFSKTKNLNPKNFQYTPEEQAKIAANPPPPAPAVQVAQIKSADAKAALAAEQQAQAEQRRIEESVAAATNQVKVLIANMRKEVDELRVKRDTDRDTVYVAAETERTRAESEARYEEMRMKERLALLDYANQHKLKLEDVKKELAVTSAKLQTEKELAGLSSAIDVHKHHNPTMKPPVQVPGKAADGHAFDQQS